MAITLAASNSGHIIFRDYATTGDGQLTACQLLSLMRRREAEAVLAWPN